MKSIFITGALIMIVIVVIGVLISTGVFWIFRILQPLVLLMFPTLPIVWHYLLVVLLIIAFVLIVGYLAKIIPRAQFFKRYLFFAGKNNIKNKPVVLVKLEALYLLGLVTENQEIIINGQKKIFKRVFLPSSPVPFTGWTVIVEEKRIIPLTISYQEILGLVSSWGAFGPQVLTFYDYQKEKDYPQVIHKKTLLPLDVDIFE